MWPHNLGTNSTLDTKWGLDSISSFTCSIDFKLCHMCWEWQRNNMSNVIMVVMWLVVQFSGQIENENKILYIKLHTHYVVYKSYMSRDHDDVMDVTLVILTYLTKLVVNTPNRTWDKIWASFSIWSVNCTQVTWQSWWRHKFKSYITPTFLTKLKSIVHIELEIQDLVLIFNPVCKLYPSDCHDGVMDVILLSP